MTLLKEAYKGGDKKLNKGDKGNKGNYKDTRPKVLIIRRQLT
jgi:hypothetical protein